MSVWSIYLIKYLYWSMIDIHSYICVTWWLSHNEHTGVNHIKALVPYTISFNAHSHPGGRQDSLVQFSSVIQSCPTLCDPMNHSTPGLPIHHKLPEFTQTHAHRVGDAIQSSHPLSSPSPPAPNPSQHQGLFQWVSSSHEVAKVLEFQLQHQSFQWTPRTDLL